MTWLVGLGLALVLLAVVAVGLSVCGAHRWARATTAWRRRVDAARMPASPDRYTARELEGLPPPVQRYFRTTLKEGQPIVRAVRVEHTGQFNLSATGEQWKAFTSQQCVVTRGPAFLWDARIAMLPGLTVRVHDGYVAGEGLLHAAVQGLFTVADLQGNGEVARGELMRFFAEAAWYPTALLPSQGVRWHPVDDRHADATLTDGPITLTLRFGFTDTGLIDSVRAEARGRTVGRRTVMTPWEGRWSDHQSRDGMIVPLAGEVAWVLPEGRRTYWRGSITSLAYELAP